jgi:hypothetical protein
LTYKTYIFIIKIKIMACKNCKGKNLDNFYGTKLKDLTDSTEKQKRKWLEKNWDESLGKLTRFERLLIFVFAWAPLLVGYFIVIRYFISLY